MNTSFFRKLAVAAFCFISASAMAQIPNAGFETWPANNNQNPERWGSANATTAQLNVYTVERASAPADVYGGSSAIKLTTKTIPIVNVVSPGVAVSGNLDINISTQAVTISGGFPLTTRPLKLTGWHKYAPQASDFCTVYIVLWRSVGGQMDTVGTAEYMNASATPNFTQFEALINYRNSNTPDSARIILSSSNPAAPVVNSSLIVDDLAFAFCNATVQANGVNPTTNNGTDGKASATVAGTNGTVNYTWSTGATSSTITGLAAGTFCVTITDGDGCEATDCVTLVDPSCQGFSVTLVGTNPTTVGGNDGEVTANVTGGTGVLNYQYSTGGGNTNLTEGNYCVTVTDENNCSVSDCTTLSDPDCSGFSVVVNTTDASSQTATDGDATAVVSNGSGTITYTWNTGEINSTITGLATGNYCVSVIDERLCTASACGDVDFPVGIDNASLVLFNIYPNPATNEITLAVSAPSAHHFSLFDLSGKLILEHTTRSSENVLSLNEIQSGIYLYAVKNIESGKTAFGKLSVQ